MQEIKLYNGEETIIYNDETHSYWRLDKENPTKKGEPRKVRLPGVTTILGVLNKPALLNWAVGVTVEYLRQHLDKIEEDPNLLLQEAKEESERIKQEAADIGSEIHEWIEQHIQGLSPEIPADENVKRGVISFLDWESQNKVKYLETEKVVYSRQYGYVGRLDILAEVNGGIYLVDIKTGNAIWPEHALQTAAYLKADMEERGTKYDGRIILRISKETEEEYVERMKEKKYFQENPDKYPYKVFEAVYLDKDGSKVHWDFAIFKSLIKIYNWQKERKI